MEQYISKKSHAFTRSNPMMYAEPKMTYNFPKLKDVFNITMAHIDNIDALLDIKDIEKSVIVVEDTTSAVITLTFIKNTDESISCYRRINIIMFQHIGSGDISYSIINGEEHGMKIIFKNISKNPIKSVDKYLPTIMGSMINMLNND